MTRDLDSYLAGLFDGEGTISAQYKPDYRGTRCYSRLLVAVAMNDARPVELFHDRFGGTFGRWSGMYKWYVTGSSALEALEVFAMLCVSKREQAALAIDLATLMKNGRARGKRLVGEVVVDKHQAEAREMLAEQITALKYNDA